MGFACDGMLDINLLRRNPKLIQENLRKRNELKKIRLLNETIKKDARYRSLLQEAESLRRKRNELTEKVKSLARTGKDIPKTLSLQSKRLMASIKKIETEVNALRKQLNQNLKNLPNQIHESVPVGKDASENIEVKVFGKKPKFDFPPRNHVQLIERLGMADLERAAKIAQARFYFLKDDLAKLDFALLNYAIDFLSKRGFQFVIPPAMMNRNAYEGVVSLEDFQNVMYKVEGEDLFLIATAEHPLIAMHAKEVFEIKDLPLKYSGFSTNFRREVGAHGIQERGIWRVHQFNKIEQVIFCHPNDSWQLHEELIKNTEQFFSSLEIPFRKVNVCTGDLGDVAAKKYDLEAWIPSANKYMEIASCSNCTDYQANRLAIRFRTNQGNKSVHTLNSTCVATSRAIVAILENNQTANCSIKIPKVLWKYLGGLKEIKA